MATRHAPEESPVAAPNDIAARLERLPFSSWHVRARIIIGIATFFDGFGLLAITFVLPVLVVAWKLKPQQIGVIISAGFAGALIGALAAGPLAERYGRLRIAGITIAIFGVMSVFCGFAWNPESLMVFRFIQGIGLGGEVPIAAAYISEIARAKSRGRFFAIYELVFPLGLLGTALLGYWLVPRFGWQMMFWIGAAPAALIFFLRRMLPESPRWLVSKGRYKEADEIVSAVERKTMVACNLPPAAATETLPPAGAQKSRWLEIFEGIYLKRTLVVWVLWIACYMTNYGLITWLPTLYRSLFHLPLSTALGYGLITQSVGFVGSMTCALVIDYVGRKLWFTIAYFGAAGSLYSLWFFGTASATAVLICASASFFFIGSIALILYLYTSELYPTRIRAFGCSIASGWLRLASTIGPILVGVIVARHGVRPVFVLFGTIALAGGLVAMIGSTETKGQVLEQLSP
ncbi:MAG TPA: MFS transporter [Patescibacteria group bacterium]|nr:MFS transporter [Patescibacteria group bacterium]